MDRVIRLRALAAKYKYPIAAALLGVFLLLLPHGEAAHTSPRDAPEARISLQSEMEATLSAFDGVGRLRLMLTGDAEEERWTGAVIVCEGGGSAAVRLQLTRAVSALTGLSTDRIAIVKGRP